MALERWLPDEAATTRLGEDLAAALRPGDLVALDGDLGAGKSTLARGLIRALAGDRSLDVPSPTFTLVQAYDLRPAIWHVDLYRLNDPSELDELGLDEALGQGVALVEWPERAGARLPPDPIQVRFEHQGEGRRVRIDGPAPAMARIARSAAMRDFLASCGWGEAHRSPFVGDASARSYEHVALPGETARIAMNAPPLVLGPPVRDGKAYAEIARTSRSIVAFVALARLLESRGFAVPPIFDADLDRGFALIGNVGHEGILRPDGSPDVERYRAAAALLADIHDTAWPSEADAAPGVTHPIPPFDRAALHIETDLLLDWYIPAVTGRPPSSAVVESYRQAWATVFDRLDKAETSLVLRDYHSPNLIWRGELRGNDRLALLDFQDALIGPSAYDVASLAMDARVTVPADVERRVVEAYRGARLAKGGFDEAGFDAAYAIMAAQRNAKILGIFVRLDRRDGKPAYLEHLPRIRDYLRRATEHPALGEVRAFLDEHDVLAERDL